MNLHHIVRKLVIVASVLAASAACPVAGAQVYLGPRIHLPPEPAFTQGRVVGGRTVPAYAPAIGGTTDDVGNVTCLASGPITRTEIYRIEASGKYYDFLKICGELPLVSDWSSWEQLRIGQPISFRIETAHVSLQPGRCERLGLIRHIRTPMETSIAVDPPSYPACRYKVTLAAIRSPNSNWTFRVIGEGPARGAGSTKIGAAYSAALAPPFS